MLNIDANQEKLPTSDLPFITFNVISTSNVPNSLVASVNVTPHLAAGVTIGVKSSQAFPGPYDATSGPAVFTVTLLDSNGQTPPQVPNPGGGHYTPNGTISLNEATLDAAGKIISLVPITFGFVGDKVKDCAELYNFQKTGAIPGNTSQVVLGDVGGDATKFYCPSLLPPVGIMTGNPWDSSTLSPGLHHFVFQYSGDSPNFAPAQSDVFDFVVARVSSIAPKAGNSQTTLVGTPFAQSLQVHVGTIVPPNAPACIPVTYIAPPTGATGFFAGNFQTVTVLTDASGNATAPVFNANSTPGSYTVTAVLPTLTAGPSTSFSLTNLGVAGTPLLTPTITSRTGAMNARLWTISVANTQGPALGASIASVGLTQVAGTACAPVLSTAVPIALGDIATNSSATAPVTIDFSSCASTARFSVSIGLQANSGTYLRTVTIGNQFP
jgi:hypothetical protein